MADIDDKISVLCVEDNPHVAEALRIKLTRTSLFEWKGWLPAADSLHEVAVEVEPEIILLDLDMPGKDPLDAASEFLESYPSARVIVFSGHVRQDLIDRALEAGAWGYASKNDGEDELVNVLMCVRAGEVALSPEVRSIYNRN
ncbi:MAG: response regulator transcription factor [Phycisphaerales bacterium]